MKKRIRYVHGVATQKDELRAGALISELLQSDGSITLTVDRNAATPLESLERRAEESEHIDVFGLCLESSKTRAGNALNVRVYDYLSGGACVADINYPVTHEAFLKGCSNLAQKLKSYLNENEGRFRDLVEGSDRV